MFKLLARSSNEIIPSSFTQYPHDPLVVFLGWLNANPRHVRKIASIYPNLYGFDTVVNFPSIFTFFSPKVAESHSFDLSSIISQKTDGKRDIIIHAMSNQGVLTLSYLLPKIQPDLVRYIFIDSAPSLLTPKIMTRGFSDAIFPSKGILHSSLSNMGDLFTESISNHFHIPETFEFQKQAIYENLGSDTGLKFLYSRSDSLIPETDVLGYMQTISKNKPTLHIESVDFFSSEHVLHYREHPEMYEAEIGSSLCSIYPNKVRLRRFLQR